MGIKTSAVEAAAAALPKYKTQRFAIAPSSTMTIVPSPPAGMVRLLLDFGTEGGPPGIYIFSDALTGASISFDLLFVGSILGTFSLFPGGPPNIYAIGGTGGNFAAPSLIPGESIQLQNLDGTYNLTAVITYLDVPDTQVTRLLMFTTGMTPIVVIPAAPAGKNRILGPFTGFGGIFQPASLNILQRDDINRGFTVINAGKTVYGDNPGNFGTGTVSLSDGPMFNVDSSGDLTLQLTESTNTTEPILYGVYRERDAG